MRRYTKKMDPANVTFTIAADRFAVEIRHPGDAEDPEPFSLDLALFGAISPEESKASVLGTKLEIRLKKAAGPGKYLPATSSNAL